MCCVTAEAGVSGDATIRAQFFFRKNAEKNREETSNLEVGLAKQLIDNNG